MEWGFPRDGFICCETGTLSIDFPNIMQCLVNYRPLPYGQGKRFKIDGSFTGVALVLHEEQTQRLLWDVMGCVGRFSYLKWKRAARRVDSLRCRPLTVAQRSAYVALYGRSHDEVAVLSRRQRKMRAAALASMEETMSFAEIVHRRRDARGGGWACLTHPPAPIATTAGGRCGVAPSAGLRGMAARNAAGGTTTLRTTPNDDGHGPQQQRDDANARTSKRIGVWEDVEKPTTSTSSSSSSSSSVDNEKNSSSMPSSWWRGCESRAAIGARRVSTRKDNLVWRRRVQAQVAACVTCLRIDRVTCTDRLSSCAVQRTRASVLETESPQRNRERVSRRSANNDGGGDAPYGAWPPGVHPPSCGGGRAPFRGERTPTRHRTGSKGLGRVPLLRRPSSLGPEFFGAGALCDGGAENHLYAEKEKEEKEKKGRRRKEPRRTPHRRLE